MFDISKLEWTREPEKYVISTDTIEILATWMLRQYSKIGGYAI